MREVVYSLEDDKAALPRILQKQHFFFVPLSFIATSMVKSNEDVVPLSRIMGDYKFLKKASVERVLFLMKTRMMSMN